MIKRQISFLFEDPGFCIDVFCTIAEPIRYDYDNKPLLKATITPSIYCLKYEQKGGSSLWRIF